MKPYYTNLEVASESGFLFSNQFTSLDFNVRPTVCQSNTRKAGR